MEQVLRYGLTLANYRRFEPIIQAAVLSYPQPIEVDWAVSDLRYGTYISRLRDAIKYLRESPGTSDWMTPELFPRLSALEVRNHPTLPTRIVIGDHETVKPAPKASFVGNPETSTLVTKYSTAPSQRLVEEVSPSLPFNVLLPKPSHQAAEGFKLGTSADETILRKAVESYATLASVMKGLPPFVLVKEAMDSTGSEQFLQQLKLLCDGYDVAIRDEPEQFVIF